MKKIIVAFFAVLAVNIGSAQSDSSYYTIRLFAFEAGITNNKINLHWKTVCLLQYAKFQIQVSSDGITYNTVDTFTADRLRCQQPFNYTDHSVRPAGKLYYRINVGNVDGRYYHSAVQLINKSESNYLPLRVFPTIVSSVVNLTVSNNSRGLLNIQIRDYNGVIVASRSVAAVAGMQTISLPAENLHAGLYVLQVINNDKQSMVAKFIKQ